MPICYSLLSNHCNLYKSECASGLHSHSLLEGALNGIVSILLPVSLFWRTLLQDRWLRVIKLKDFEKQLYASNKEGGCEYGWSLEEKMTHAVIGTLAELGTALLPICNSNYFAWKLHWYWQRFVLPYSYMEYYKMQAPLRVQELYMYDMIIICQNTFWRKKKILFCFVGRTVNIALKLAQYNYIYMTNSNTVGCSLLNVLKYLDLP